MSPAGWGALVLANDHPSGLVVNKGTTAHGVRHSYLLADRSVTLTGGRWTVATSRRPPSCRSPSQGLAADGTDVPDDRRNVTGRRGEGAVGAGHRTQTERVRALGLRPPPLVEAARDSGHAAPPTPLRRSPAARSRRVGRENRRLPAGTTITCRSPVCARDGQTTLAHNSPAAAS